MAFLSVKKLYKNSLSKIVWAVLWLILFYCFFSKPFAWIFNTRDRRKSLDKVSVDNNPTLGEKWNILIMRGPYDLCLLRLYGNNIFLMQKQVESLQYKMSWRRNSALWYEFKTWKKIYDAHLQISIRILAPSLSKHFV